MTVNIGDDILRLWRLGLLERLLADKSTGKNIMWATDAFSGHGHQYERNQEITTPLITGDNADVIKTRARKAMEQQSVRTRQRAEVFTPLWVVRKMNDYADEMWFGYPDVFFKDGKPTEQVRFFENSHTWQDYVDSRRLEITCGEAPYLVSRYDVETGEAIPIKNRVGILDRKLRVINENAETEEEWLKWCVRAFEATYGYEFQGDSLLIARVNLIMTFEDYMLDRWGRKPTKQENETISLRTIWNLWQMDGLTGKTPYKKSEIHDQFQLDEVVGKSNQITEPIPCVIYDWRGRYKVKYSELKRGGK